MVKPIPIQVLTDSIQYIEFDRTSRDEDLFKTPIAMNNVRIQKKDSLFINTIQEKEAYSHILFFDIVHSTPKEGFTFKPKSKVIHEGKEFTVIGVEPCKAFTLHHYELQLI